MKQTVIIPAHNEKDIVEDLLKHLRSLGKDLEIIVVANGCTDDTAKRAAKLADRVVEEEEGNLPKAKNVGMKYITTDLVTFLDADSFPDKQYFDEAERLYTGGFFENYDGFYPRIYSLEGDKKGSLYLYHLFCLSPIRSATGGCMTMKTGRFGAGFNEDVYNDDHDMAKRHRFKYMPKLKCLTSTRRLNEVGSWGMFKFYVKAYFQLIKRKRPEIYKSQTANSS
jgi:glycosyltransferase involved in cell wall biosynthesis